MVLEIKHLLSIIEKKILVNKSCNDPCDKYCLACGMWHVACGMWHDLP